MMSLFDEEEVLKSYIRSECHEAAQKAAQDKARKTAIHLIKLGQMSLEDIAEATELSIDSIKELEKEVMQLS